MIPGKSTRNRFRMKYVSKIFILGVEKELSLETETFPNYLRIMLLMLM